MQSPEPRIVWMPPRVACTRSDDVRARAVCPAEWASTYALRRELSGATVAEHMGAVERFALQNSLLQAHGAVVPPAGRHRRLRPRPHHFRSRLRHRTDGAPQADLFFWWMSESPFVLAQEDRPGETARSRRDRHTPRPQAERSATKTILVGTVPAVTTRLASLSREADWNVTTAHLYTPRLLPPPPPPLRRPLCAVGFRLPTPCTCSHAVRPGRGWSRILRAGWSAHE